MTASFPGLRRSGLYMIDQTDFGTGLRAHLQLEAPLLEEQSEPTTPVATEDELAERLELLDRAERALAERARELDLREMALAEEAVRLHAIRSELSSAGPGTDARAVLRERVEQQAELVWRIFEEALGATAADGRADHAARLAAAKTLLSEAYPRERA